MAGSGLRSKLSRDRNSPAICWASAALPPLPATRILFPLRSAAAIASVARIMACIIAPSLAARSRVSHDRRKCSAMLSWRDPAVAAMCLVLGVRLLRPAGIIAGVLLVEACAGCLIQVNEEG